MREQLLVLKEMFNKEVSFVKVNPSEVKVGCELKTPMFNFAMVTKVIKYPNSDMVKIVGLTHTGDIEKDFFTSEDVLLAR